MKRAFKEPTPPADLMTIEQAAESFGFAIRKLNAIVDAGRVPHYFRRIPDSQFPKVERLIRHVSAAELRRYMATKRRSNPNPEPKD